MFIRSFIIRSYMDSDIRSCIPYSDSPYVTLSSKSECSKYTCVCWTYPGRHILKDLVSRISILLPRLPFHNASCCDGWLLPCTRMFSAKEGQIHVDLSFASQSLPCIICIGKVALLVNPININKTQAEHQTAPSPTAGHWLLVTGRWWTPPKKTLPPIYPLTCHFTHDHNPHLVPIAQLELIEILPIYHHQYPQATLTPTRTLTLTLTRTLSLTPSIITARNNIMPSQLFSPPAPI